VVRLGIYYVIYIIMDNLTTDIEHHMYGHFRTINADKGISAWIVKQYVWEKYIFDIIEQYVKPNTTIVDIGGHIGCHTLGILNHTLKNMIKNGVDISATHVIAVEPQPFLYNILKYNIDNNDTPVKKTTLNCGLSNINGTAFMQILDYSTCPNPGGRGVHINNRNDEMMDVNIITLDSLNLENVSFMKIDVEGHEVQVIKGAMQTIEKYKPVMIVEILGGTPYDNATSVQKQYITDTRNFIRSLGYSCEIAGASVCDYLCLPLI
jgi:FkbM family methyltransferase